MNAEVTSLDEARRNAQKARAIISELHSSVPSRHGGEDMNARIAVLEQISKNTQDILKEMKEDIRSVRSDVFSLKDSTLNEFKDARKEGLSAVKWLVGLITTAALGLAALAGHGFKWF